MVNRATCSFWRAAAIRVIDDGRYRRMIELLGVVWLLSIADLFFTLWAHRFTPFYEENPIARAMLHGDAIGLLVLFKLGTTLTGSALFWLTRKHGRAEAALWCVAVAYVMLAVRWSDYTSRAPYQVPGVTPMTVVAMR